MVACGLLALASSVYLVYVLEILKLRRGRLNPETGEFEAIELERRPKLVTGCDKPHEPASESQSSGRFGYSRASARSSRDGRILCLLPSTSTSWCWPPRSRFSCSADCPLLGYAVGAGVWLVAARHPGLRRRAAPTGRTRRRQPPEGDGDRRRDDARPRLADGDRGPARRRWPSARPASPPRSSSSSSSPSPSPPRASPTSSEPEGRERMSESSSAESGEVGASTKAKVFIGLGVYLGDRDPDAADLRQLAAKTKPSSPRTSSSSNRGSRSTSAGIDLSINKAVLYLVLASALTIGTMVWISRRMQQKPNRVQTAIEVAYDMTKNNDHRRQPGREDGGPLVPLPRRALLLDLVLEHDRLPAAADQHRAHGQRLRRRNPLLRDLRGHRQPLDPAGPDPGRLGLLPRRRDPGQGPLQVPGQLAAAGPGGHEPARPRASSS